MIFYIVGFGIMLYGLKNYKKGLTMYIAYSLMLSRNITLFSLIPLSTFMTLFFIMLYFVRGIRKNYCQEKFPLKVPFILITISIVVSSIFSITGFGSEITTMLGNITKEIVLIWVLWRTVETKNDMRFLFKAITFVIGISVMYGYVEYIIQDNIYADYARTLVSASKVTNWEYGETFRGYRVYSIFDHTIGAGINWSLYSIFVFYLYINYKESLVKLKYPIIIATLSLPLIILTRMRSCMIFFLMCAVVLIINKSKKKYRLIPIILIGILLIWPYLQSNIIILQSLFNAEAQSLVKGSSLGLRGKQFENALRVMKIAPIAGLGTQFMQVLSSKQTYWLLGLEGIALQVTTQYGLIGVMAYIVKLIYDLIIIPRKYKSWSLCILAGSYWVIEIFTSTPGMSLPLYYLFVFFLIKGSEEYKKNLCGKELLCNGILKRKTESFVF